MSSHQRICREFARDGKCKFRNCKFSHDIPKSSATKKPELTRSESDFRTWRRQVPLEPTRTRPLGNQQLGSFFQEARRLVDQDVGVLQEVVRALAREGGLKRLQELIEGNHLATLSTSQKSAVFTNEMLPFLGIMTHPGVLASLILEQALGTIYNFLYGLAGRRALVLLGFLADVLRPSEGQVTEAAVNHLEMSLLLFWQIIELNSTAFVNDGLKPVAERFQVILEEYGRSQSHSGSLYNVKLYMDRILRRLSIGDALPTATTPGQAGPTDQPILPLFKINQTPPGGRHDNDSTDICSIRILPTSEEILSPHTEYLPVKDPQQWHLAGVSGLLDWNFRLLRQDTVGQLRDAIHALLRPTTGGVAKAKNQLRTYAYPNVRVASLSFNRHAGLEFVLEFRQLDYVQRLSSKQREEWWNQSKRLQGGALVCLVDADGKILFCTAAEPRLIPPGNPRPKDIPSLSDHKDIASVALELTDPGEEDVQYILDRYRTRGSTVLLTLVEFPGVLLPAFDPTLRALQRMKRSGDLPFATLLAPLSLGLGNHDQGTVPPPGYALRPGFSFDLSCLMTDKTPLELRPGQAFDIQKLRDHSVLDRAQAVALVNTLQHRIGLIQGPPGTGKSYTGVALIQVLLANAVKAKANIGPIICVCYTNHALDQLLEELLKKKITTQIVRIGSRSKSEIVDRYSLRKLIAKPTPTKPEKSALWELHHQLEECEKAFVDVKLHSEGSEHGLKRFLRNYNPRHYRQLMNNLDDEGFQAVQHNRRNGFQQWVKAGPRLKGKARSIESLQDIDPDDMSAQERQILYRHWLEENRRQLHEKVKDLVNEQRAAKEELNDVRSEVDLRCLREAQVIGVTTTGLARNLKMLRRLQSKVVLCEEAGEVLEAHLLTALLPSVEHAILIGDHLQLRPQIQDYELSRENTRGGEQYSLDRSLFERLVDPDDGSGVQIPFSTLETQRRMHPSIAQLVRDTLYPRLEDASSVTGYPEVCGMRRRLFWFDHQHPEANSSNTDALGTSHSNPFEVEMTTALVTHLLRQGSYTAGDIAVLTPYLGQLHRLRRRLSESFSIVLGERDQEDLGAAGLDNGDGDTQIPVVKATALQTIRAATIDNFQGEEAKVVVISLVRSNAQRRCGFLRTSNRINVLLSRAKHGMYIIGNSATSCDVAMWRQVVDILQSNGNFGTHLDLQCPRHPESPIAVSEPDHFMQYSPEGGCNQRCVNRLQCGHACKQKCHSTLLHDAVYCQEPCPRPLKGCDHGCPKLCGDKCPKKCQVNVVDANRRLECGHAAKELPCWQAQNLSLVLCPVRVEKKVRGCNHTAQVACHVDVGSPAFKCQAICGTNLPCGHTCKHPCWKCTISDADNNVQTNHGSCNQPCGRKYSTCVHTCRKVCHGSEPCPACEAPCDVQCGHSKCPNKCCEPCAPCAQDKCLSSCPHGECTLPCAAPCDNVPCSKRCEKLLACGHRCPSVCGEICPPPEFCQTCAPAEIKDRIVDFILSEAYREINLDENPCIFPRCGHFLTMESMDGQMDMKGHYALDSESKPVAIKLSSEPFSVEDIKRCATCRGSLRDISRYGRLVRRAILDESTKKFILYINNEYVPMAQELPELLAKLQSIRDSRSSFLFRNNVVIQIKGSSDQQIKFLGNLMQKHDPSRWNALIRLRQRMVRYCGKVKLEEQPFSRVQALVERARRVKEAKGTFEFNESVVQTKGILLAKALLIRLDIALLGDFLSLYKGTKADATRGELHVNLQANLDECRELIDSATQLKRVVHQVEGYIFLGQLCALQRSHVKDSSDAERWQVEGRNAIGAARDLCGQYPGQTNGLSEEIDGTEAMLRGSTFYSAVSSEERRAVIAAMARELHGTGHWYYCPNGHPFTIGECGHAMQVSVCPECGAAVGGQHHQALTGVRHADDLERELGNLHL
ncbi:P-loop containing nucleoside triphosphate hydrolase protein [Aspergillus sclerotiicarbonarius CBS 121057]|uniref:P-loop containing nucleoside triphosphate hydrolase protein n=1 Tax=Aspergillus sclerotiicarbonarius (strain CBS 121057 / IBT 28362) TaxID=1448318 RepID=A0A319EH10_ASPSB|nr:P-loop containing nucleoside triphosphate hydrolase protein [Aspergillus sclerotiicarbonarius CBS 121057]